MRRLAVLLASVLLLAALPAAGAEPLRVAVAANFAPALEELAALYAGPGAGTIEIVVGSTGRLYAQIVNGAPFALFFAADAERPARLVEAGLAAPEDRFPYAVGRLVLWSADPDVVDAEGLVLAEDHRRRLALANPRLAPYGRAAREALATLGLEEFWTDRIVEGENVSQVVHFVETGNADLGLTALSLVAGRGGSSWLVPARLHRPVEQHAVILSDAPDARAFADFVRSAEAAAVLAAHGYELPAEAP